MCTVQAPHSAIPQPNFVPVMPNVSRRTHRTFPNESKAYRAARDRLLAQEVELRRMMEALAASRRALPFGGEVPEDYVFHGLRPDGALGEVRLSELFAPGRDSLVVYSMMFPRYPGMIVLGRPRQVRQLDCPCLKGPARPVWRWWISLTVRRRTSSLG